MGSGVGLPAMATRSSNQVGTGRRAQGQGPTGKALGARPWGKTRGAGPGCYVPRDWRTMVLVRFVRVGVCRRVSPCLLGADLAPAA